jgi:RNA polymerase sigma-70 factor (ECF subfamily)
MLRTAQAYVGTRAAAEDVVQDTWIAAISALDRFEGRSAVRTWLFSILLNIARSRRVRDRRTVPFSSLLPEESGPSVDPTRFLPAGDPDWPHHWLTPPRRWTIPEDALLSSEIRVRIRAALDDLPPRQAAVVSLHDVQGYPVAEVCILLELSPGNVRILLHRGRTRIRESLERYLVDGST